MSLIIQPVEHCGKVYILTQINYQKCLDANGQLVPKLLYNWADAIYSGSLAPIKKTRDCSPFQGCQAGRWVKKKFNVTD